MLAFQGGLIDIAGRNLGITGLVSHLNSGILGRNCGISGISGRNLVIKGGFQVGFYTWF